jgi:uncharacterized protein
MKENPMKSSASPDAQAERHNASTRERPIIVPLAFFLVVFVLRSIDSVLGLDKLSDPYIFSRVLGFLVVLGYLWVLRKPINSIGLHARHFDKAFLIGMCSLASLYAVLYGVQFYRLSLAGENPRLVFAAINTETAVMGGLFFTSFYLVGQLFNAFMEESIFRGVILPHLMLRFSFWKANVLQASLFGLAHLIFPISSWLSGQATTAEAATGAAYLLIATTVGGLVFGYLYYRTDSLWTAVFAHLIDNVMVLFFHIQTVDRLNAETDISMVARLGFVALIIVAWAVSKRSNLPSLKPWGTK